MYNCCSAYIDYFIVLFDVTALNSTSIPIINQASLTNASKTVNTAIVMLIFIHEEMRKVDAINAAVD